MKVLKWLSLVFAIIACLFVSLSYSSVVGMIGYAYDVALVMLAASLAFIALGPILLSYGTFKNKKTLVILGAVIFVAGIALFFIARAINVNYLYGNPFGNPDFRTIP